MGKKKLNIAICYDFDGTLSPGNMQEHSLLPELKLNSHDFWKEVKDLAKANGMNEILSYMYLILEKAILAHKEITRKAFQKHGENIPLFEGVENYFNDINSFAKEKNIIIEHYIISSGLKEIIEGIRIFKNFKYVFASQFYYDVNHVAKWPAVAIDYTGKTQYLFRINKGIFNVWDNTTINNYIEENERYLPFRRMIYIGDGETDIPSMKMVNYQGGYSIAVFDPKKRNNKSVSQKLVMQGRAKFIAEANYSRNGELYKLLTDIITKIILEEKLRDNTKKIMLSLGRKKSNGKPSN